ncbi:MAG: hypothetical protein AAF468_19295 [Pseudomonadota bacterium]
MIRYAVMIAITGVLGSTGVATALTIKNADSNPVTVSVTQNGVRTDLPLAAGETQSVCPSGCFIRFPNGDMQIFKGDENVVVQGGSGRIQQ